jgi:transposase
MSQELTVTTERVDDIPVLLANTKRMGLSPLINEHFPPHGNWQGLPPGEMTCVWLAHLLSEADHRLNHVRGWAEKRLLTLSETVGQAITGLDFTDDRLGLLLDRFGEEAAWRAFETALSGRLIRVYDLAVERVRVDSTTVCGYWTVDADGLFQFGHSKDRRPDLPQLKVMLSALDPLGLPLASQVVAGNRSDDPLYIPAIRQIQHSLGRRGLLYVGDSKLLAGDTRAFIHAQGDFYLGPLSKTQLPEAILASYLAPVWQGQASLTSIYRTPAGGQTEQIAVGFEREERMQVIREGQVVQWTERRLVIRSLSQQQTREQALQKRLGKAQQAVEKLNELGKGKKCYTDVAEMRQKAEARLAQHQVRGLLELRFEAVSVVTSPKGKPKRVLQVRVRRDEAAIQDIARWFGWRVFATNQGPEGLSVEQAVLAYRDQYVVERSFGRLKGKPLSLRPMYLQDDRRATGLVRLLSLGLKVLTLLEYGVRQKLSRRGESLAGLYAGNPKRTTARPTAEALLAAFKDITLSVVTLNQQVLRHVTPLSKLQLQILALLDLPNDLYERLTGTTSTPP